MWRNRNLLALFSVAAVTVVIEASPRLLEDADTAWEQIGTPLHVPEGLNGKHHYHQTPWGLSPSEDEDWLNRSRQRYRELGLTFWERFPDDVRKFRWLRTTVHSAPFYSERKNETSGSPNPSGFKGWQADDVAQRTWVLAYPAMRAEYLASDRVSAEDKGFLLGAELWHKIHEARKADKTDAWTVRMIELVCAMQDYAKMPHPDNVQLSSCLSTMRVALSRDDELAQAAYEAFSLSSNEKLREFGNAQRERKQLEFEAFNFSFRDFDGKLVDAGSLRGKIVVLDFWSNYCGTCIESMPKIAALYRKYRGDDVEIIGMWLALTNEGRSVEQEIDRARSVISEKGAQWRNLVVPLAQAATYGVYGVPRYWILDRNGLLKADVSRTSDLEQQLRKVLSN